MRLLSLDAASVGHWNVPLQLPLGRRLTVVLGDNEAGKSTLRRAIRALLFGPDKALAAPLLVSHFDLSAEVELQRGETGSIHRRGRNLQGEVPGGAATLLVDANRGRYEALFDLAHDNLWPTDAADLLKADGLLGSLMFGARTGLAPMQLEQARRQLGRALDDIKSGRKGVDGIPARLKRYQQAQEWHEALVRFEASDAGHAELEAHAKEVERLEAELGRLGEEQRRLAGLIAGADDVEELEEQRRKLASLEAGGKPAPLTAITALEAHYRRCGEALEAAEEADAGLTEAGRHLAEAPDPGDLHRLAPRCEELRAGAVACASGREELQELQDQQAERLRVLRQVLERLGTAPGDDPAGAARSLLRPEPVLAPLEALLRTRAELVQERKEKEALQSGAQRRLDALGAGTDEAGVVDVQALEAIGPRLEAACAAEVAIDRLECELAGAAQPLQRQQSGLGLGGEAVSPHALPLPGEEAARALETAQAAARSDAEVAADRVVELENTHAELQEQLERDRQRLGSVATADEVAAARELRDSRLGELRSSLDDPAALADLPALRRISEELGQLVRQADLLVDGRVDAGEALGRLRSEEARLQELADDLGRAQDAAREAAAHLQERSAEFARLWPFLRSPPESVPAWFAAFTAWREAWEAQQEREAERKRQAGVLEAARKDIVAAVGGLVPGLSGMATAQAMRTAVDSLRKRGVERAGQLKAQAEARRRVEEDLRQADAELSAVEQRLSVWQQDWDAAVEVVPGTVEPVAASVERWLQLQESLGRALEEFEKVAASIEVRRGRLEDGEARIRTLLREVRELDPAQAPPAALDPATAFAMVDRACRDSAQRRDVRERLEEAHARARDAAARARDARERAQGQLQEAWQQAGGVDECTAEGMDALSQRANTAHALRQQIAELESRLTGRWGDDLAASVALIRGDGVEALRARLADVDEALKKTRGQRDEAADRRRDAQAALDAMRQGADATAVAQELADAREALFDKLAERSRLQLAEMIADRAWHEASDGGQSLEEQAGEWFSRLTDGAFTGLRIDRDDPGKPKLVAVESTRLEKGMDELSAGTRDQVWLALRLAAIVAAAEETPFPLLLDDSLVQFDDTRARAALRLLHEVSERVQVILFTHHDHLADLAEEVVPVEDLAVLVLPGVSGEMRARAAATGARRARARPEPVPEDADDGAGSAADPVPRRRRSSVDRGRAKELILQVLANAAEPLGKEAVLGQNPDPDFDLDAAWQPAIRELLAEERVHREGERRGATYQLLR